MYGKPWSWQDKQRDGPRFLFCLECHKNMNLNFPTDFSGVWEVSTSCLEVFSILFYLKLILIITFSRVCRLQQVSTAEQGNGGLVCFSAVKHNLPQWKVAQTPPEDSLGPLMYCSWTWSIVRMAHSNKPGALWYVARLTFFGLSARNDALFTWGLPEFLLW